MAAVRSIFTSMLVFTLLAIVLGTMVAPKILSAQLCSLENRPSCVAAVEYATTNLVRYQLFSAAGGAIIGLIVGIVIAVSSRQRKSSAQIPSAPAPTPTAAKPPVKTE